MAGLRGLLREPQVDPRARRNSQTLANDVQFVVDGSIISIDDEGFLQADLRDDGGLENDNGELAIKLDSTPGLALATTGISALTQGVIATDASGIKLNFGDGLQESAGTLETDINGLTPETMVDGSSDFLMMYDASASALRKVNPNNLTGSSFSGAKVGKTGTQSIPTATNTLVEWDSETFDTDTYHDNVTNNTRLTVPRDGRYMVAVSIQWDSWSVTGARFRLRLQVSGTDRQKIHDEQLNNSTKPTRSGSTVLDLSAGNYVEVQVFQNSGGPESLAAGCFASLVEIK